MFVFALFLTLHSYNNSVTTYDCQYCWLAADEPTMQCIKTTNVNQTSILLSICPLNQTNQTKLSSVPKNHFIPLFSFQKPLFLCLFLLDDKGFAV